VFRFCCSGLRYHAVTWVVIIDSEEVTASIFSVLSNVCSILQKFTVSEKEQDMNLHCSKNLKSFLSRSCIETGEITQVKLHWKIKKKKGVLLKPFNCYVWFHNISKCDYVICLHEYLYLLNLEIYMYIMILDTVRNSFHFNSLHIQHIKNISKKLQILIIQLFVL
jgi:hypothetical protein